QTNWGIPLPTFTSYSGVPNGETTAYVPYVRKVTDEVITQINVQNVGSEPAPVYVTYYDAQGTVVDTEVAAFVPPAATRCFDQAANADLSATFSGSAIVTSTQPVAAIGFISRRQGSQVTVDATTGATLVYTDTQGIPTDIQVPAGAVDEPTTLVYVPATDITAPAGFIFAGRAFDISAYQNDTSVPTLTFNVPITVTLHYTDTDVTGLDEAQLQLQTWDEQASAWVDAACGAYDRHPAENWLAVPICHLSRFALFGTLPPATITKRVSPEGQIHYGDELTYTLVISGASGTETSVYDPMTDTTFLRFAEQPTGIEYADHAITGTVSIPATISFVVRVGVPSTVGWVVDVTNRACVYPVDGTLDDCVWSDAVTNQASRPYQIYLPLVLRNH
ncbi:MAG: hypothetical protein JXR84_17290, partial [Anaerolineae bacterium]|nr:hypothetical protein [Anaerolineae bacterium]